ncbi:hypothetical protein ABI59_23385 [Acidobacteria bacterium Mor1]|nr:hypothetical protein ABI59_23385 [Acidobacteria bacterium Mor1]
MKAVWNDEVLAESDETVVVESNHYFPPSSLKQQFLRPSDTRTHCPWKGNASYFHVEVEGMTLPDAAWTYQAPKDAAREITGHVAFWKGVEVRE